MGGRKKRQCRIILTVCIAHKNHLVQQLAAPAVLGHNLPVHEQQLLNQVVALGRPRA